MDNGKENGNSYLVISMIGVVGNKAILGVT